MRMAAGPSSPVETREAPLIQARSGGICAATPPEPASGSRVPSARNHEVGESTDRDAAAIAAVMSDLKNARLSLEAEIEQRERIASGD